MTPAEIGRMSREKCIILLEGQQPVLDDKVRPFSDKIFLYAKSLGRYKNPVVVKLDEQGQYQTIKSPGSLEELSEESVAYYKNLAKEGKARIYELDEEEFLRWNLKDE